MVSANLPLRGGDLSVLWLGGCSRYHPAGPGGAIISESQVRTRCARFEYSFVRFCCKFGDLTFQTSFSSDYS